MARDGFIIYRVFDVYIVESVADSVVSHYRATQVSFRKPPFFKIKDDDKSLFIS